MVLNMNIFNRSLKFFSELRRQTIQHYETKLYHLRNKPENLYQLDYDFRGDSEYDAFGRDMRAADEKIRIVNVALREATLPREIITHIFGYVYNFPTNRLDAIGSHRFQRL